MTRASSPQTFGCGCCASISIGAPTEPMTTGLSTSTPSSASSRRPRRRWRTGGRAAGAAPGHPAGCVRTARRSSVRSPGRGPFRRTGRSTTRTAGPTAPGSETNGEDLLISARIYALARMFGPCQDLMLASMSQLEWSEPADVRSSMASLVSGLPTGTVTLLLADVEGSTRLWETQPAAMTAAIARLDATLTDLVTANSGVRPIEQGEGDSFVVAFARASDAVACALALQRAPLAPIRLRIGVNTGEIQLRDEGNYIGPTINRTARLRDLGHGGQTLLSGATESMVIDHLPDDAWLNDLGSHPLRDLPRPERVVQLCHPDICNEFPPLRVREAVAVQRLPVQLTSFVGRVDEVKEMARLVDVNRLVTLTGAGGVGKT